MDAIHPNDAVDSGTLIDGTTAWANLAHSGFARWTTTRGTPRFEQTAHGRLDGGIVMPRVRPKFKLRETDEFFCIGSSFARNIEEHLAYRGISVSSTAIAAPRNEWGARPNGFVSKFTTASILNELRWTFGEATFPADAIIEDNDGWRDLQLSPGIAPVGLPRAIERREAVRQYFSRIRNASVVVVTLGLVEAWYDRQSRVFLNTAPSSSAAQRQPDRFALQVTGYLENRSALDEIIALLNKYGRRDLRVVLTVSPVPMSETFSGEDVITANAYSKAILRAVAGDVAREHGNVQYFPSFESIVTTDRTLAYSRIDELHVADPAVDAVTAHFLHSFGIDRVRPHPEFNELEYIFAHEDVYDAIVSGAVRSGYEHWLAYGRNEGRSLCANDDQRPWLLDL